MSKEAARRPVADAPARGARVGIPWRGEDGERGPRADRGLAPRVESPGGSRLDVAPVPFADGRVEADDDAFGPLRRRAEREWVPEMAHLVTIDPLDLPVIWGADFLFGPPDESGRDRDVLCEIDASAVRPFPPVASAAIAARARARIDAARRSERGA